MKKIVLLSLILVLIFSGYGFVEINVGEKIEWEEAPPLAPWTVLFSAHGSDTGTYGEIIIAENKDEELPKLFGTTIYCEADTNQADDIFFEAIYIGDNRPIDFIEIISRGGGKYPSVIQREELKEITEMINGDDSWVILTNTKIKTSPF